ncbi:hypothetical protein GUJ93_ZPchr0010g9150 [Zizania palustris]|uniref:Transcription factor n=1 Tax=Zizania palustris TaxID=103762 RepID=A0A8J5WG80_ZIZPA|nr:hypothetical protein GUJ93_ZPchr0010g9150 [Zizania palustris]
MATGWRPFPRLGLRRRQLGFAVGEGGGEPARRAEAPGPEARAANPTVPSWLAESATLRLSGKRRDKLNPPVLRPPRHRADGVRDGQGVPPGRRRRLHRRAARPRGAARGRGRGSEGALRRGGSLAAGGLEFDLEVRMVDRVAAALRLTSSAAATHHAPAILMSVLRSLDMEVQHACVCRVGAVTVQDAVVDVPAALQDEGRLRTALLHRLWKSGV